MDDFIRLVGPNRAVEIGGVKLVGVTAENGGKLLLTAAFVVLLLLLGRVLRRRPCTTPCFSSRFWGGWCSSTGGRSPGGSA